MRSRVNVLLKTSMGCPDVDGVRMHTVHPVIESSAGVVDAPRLPDGHLGVAVQVSAGLLQTKPHQKM
jgi:hypothetical protein